MTLSKYYYYYFVIITKLNLISCIYSFNNYYENMCSNPFLNNFSHLTEIVTCFNIQLEVEFLSNSSSAPSSIVLRYPSEAVARRTALDLREPAFETCH